VRVLLVRWQKRKYTKHKPYISHHFIGHYYVIEIINDIPLQICPKILNQYRLKLHFVRED